MVSGAVLPAVTHTYPGVVFATELSEARFSHKIKVFSFLRLNLTSLCPVPNLKTPGCVCGCGSGALLRVYMTLPLTHSLSLPLSPSSHFSLCSCRELAGNAFTGTFPAAAFNALEKVSTL